MNSLFSLIILLATTCVRYSLQLGRQTSVRGITSLRQSSFVGDVTSVIPPLCTEPPLKILLLVEPTPFNYVSGYANRFKEMLKFLHTAGDEVRVLTADKDPKPPSNFMGYPITTNRGFEFILYNQITLTFDFKMQTERLIKEFRPDIIHVSSPSSIIWPAIIWSRIYNIPLVMSYHTNFAEYSRTYGGFPGAVYLSYKVLKWFHNQADLTLCTSPQLALDLVACGVRRVDVWQKGINAEVNLALLWFSMPLSLSCFLSSCPTFLIYSPLSLCALTFFLCLASSLLCQSYTSLVLNATCLSDALSHPNFVASTLLHFLPFCRGFHPPSVAMKWGKGFPTVMWMPRCWYTWVV